MCVPAFASSWIGSRSGVVRYDEFSGCSSPVFHRRAHLFTYFIVSVSLFSFYPYVAILSSHVSYSPVTHMNRVTYPLSIAVVCCLGLASRSACLGICCYLFICWVCWELSHAILLLEILTLTLLLTTKIVSSGICEPLCESIGYLSR